MQNDKKVKEEMELFLMPVAALKAAGIEDGDELLITAKEGKILIEKVEDEEEYEDECPICPCYANKKR